MKDFLIKIEILSQFLSDSFSEWYGYIWKNDLDARYCCDGRECGCGGATIRELYNKKRIK